jgi:hypothetical protein
MGEEPTRIFHFKKLSRWSLASGLVLGGMTAMTWFPPDVLMSCAKIDTDRTTPSASSLETVSGLVGVYLDAAIALLFLVAALLALMERAIAIRLSMWLSVAWLMVWSIGIPIWLSGMASRSAFSNFGTATTIATFAYTAVIAGVLPLALPMKVLLLVRGAPLWVRSLPRAMLVIGVLTFWVPCLMMVGCSCLDCYPYLFAQ